MYSCIVVSLAENAHAPGKYVDRLDDRMLAQALLIFGGSARSHHERDAKPLHVAFLHPQASFFF
jgi:hypothetical protein